MQNTSITVAILFQKDASISKHSKIHDVAGRRIIRTLITTIFFVIVLLTSKDTFAERKPTIIKKQAVHYVQVERAVQLISPSGDPYDSFRNLSLQQISGIPISIPVDVYNNGAYVNQGGVRALPVSFECDYSKGITRGEARLSYQHPRNLYDSISGFIVVECLPLNENEKAQQIALNEQRLREELLRREEEERSRLDKLEKEELQRKLQEKAEAVRREEEEKEIARKASPSYKRELAEQNIKRMRAEIRAAEVRIAEERRVGNLSGYVDKRRLHELGSLIVAAEREIVRNWVIYRENGGTARSVDSIR